MPEDLRAGVGAEPVERHLDALNRELLDRLQRDGEVFVSNAVIDGRYVLRACIVNFHTERADVEALPEIVVRRGRALRAGAQHGAERPGLRYLTSTSSMASRLGPSIITAR